MKARRGDGESRLRAGQCALVTGAGSGIGRAIALALAREGLHVRLVGRDAEKLRQVADCAGGTASVVAADITTEEGRAAIAVATRPDLHVLVHCAGAYSRGSVADTPVSTWSTLSATNLHAPLLVTAACLPQLRAAPGQVAFINSTAVMRPGAGIAAYAASKQALRAAVDALREEVNGDGIRVISMFPGRTATPMQKDILAAEGRVARPGALIEPDDIAQMLLAALRLPLSAEVTDIVMRPMRPL